MQSDKKLYKFLKKYQETLPSFHDGRIDYTNSKSAPVVVVFLKYKEKMLLLKRSKKVNSYKGKWQTIAGYIDDFRSVYERMMIELHEEIGLNKKDIKEMRIANQYKVDDKKIKKVWFVNPGIAYLKRKPKVKIDWEHTDYKWINPSELKKFSIVYKVDESYRRAVKGKKIKLT